ncbi:chaperone modulator CbpM [Jatrophihabitans sp. DSM 45814]
MTMPRSGSTGAGYAIAIVPSAPRVGLETFARRAGVHPEMVERYVALGLLDEHRDANGALWFAPNQLPELARIRRLRAGLQVNYAGLGVVIDLLDRIQRLEDALRKQRPLRSQPWT